MKDLTSLDKLTPRQKRTIETFHIPKEIKKKTVKVVDPKNIDHNPHRLDPLPHLLTLREVAAMLRLSTLTVKRWVKKGLIKSIRINSRGDHRFFREEIEKVMRGKHD